MLRIYFNPECSKCQSALQLISDNSKEELQVVEYLVETPSVNEIREILSMLGMKAKDLVRKKEPLYIEKYDGKDFSEAEWIQILHENPVLIGRPIIVKDGKAILGRPVERVLDIL